MATTRAQQLHSIEQLIALFLELDTNKDGNVHRDELIEFYKKHNLDEKEIETWMKRFDADSDGRITLDEYCRGLGMKMEEIVKEKEERKVQREKAESGPPKFPDAEIISSSMSWTKQTEVIEKFRELYGTTDPSADQVNTLVGDLQEFLNEQFGRVWQCIILEGSFWMKYTHEPFMSIQFRYKDKYIVLAWRTHRV